VTTMRMVQVSHNHINGMYYVYLIYEHGGITQMASELDLESATGVAWTVAEAENLPDTHVFIFDGVNQPTLL
jgi:hypothetical protein